MTPSKWAVAAAVLAVCGSACSSGDSRPAGAGGQQHGAATTTTTAATAPPVINLTASPAPWRLADPVSRPVVLPDGSDFVILGGLATGDTSTSRIVTVDPASGRSRISGQLAVAVHDSAGAAIGGVTSTSEGGTAETDAIQRVNLASGRVTVAGRLPEPMGHATALVLDGQIFVLGGRSGAVPSAAIRRLDPATGALTLAGQLPAPVSDAGSVPVGGVGYLVGGEVTGPTRPLDSVVVLRPSLRG